MLKKAGKDELNEKQKNRYFSADPRSHATVYAQGRRRIRMQKLNVELSVEIPAEYVLITKVEYEELKSNELRSVYWNMKELEKRTGRPHG